MQVDDDAPTKRLGSNQEMPDRSWSYLAKK